MLFRFLIVEEKSFTHVRKMSCYQHKLGKKPKNSTSKITLSNIAGTNKSANHLPFLKLS